MATLSNPISANDDYVPSFPVYAGKRYVFTVDGTFDTSTIALQSDTGSGFQTITGASFTAYGSIVWTADSQKVNINVSSVGASTSVYVTMVEVQ